MMANRAEKFMPANGSQEPQISKMKSLPGPDDITRARLENGITLLSRANFNSPSVTISGLLPVGALFDPDERLGLADFTASALMRGTVRRSFQRIYEALESCGANLGFDSSTHTTRFYGRALAEDLDLLLELLAECLRQPAFPAEQVERLRAQLLTGLAIRAQDTAEMAALAFDEIVYAGHPYSRPEDGYTHTVEAIRQEDLATFHERFYGPDGLLIAVVGGVDPALAIEKISAALGDWRNPHQPKLTELPPLNPLSERRQKKVTLPGKSQADILIGAAGPARRSPDYLAASLGNNVLGQFGMMGRLGESIREQAGLAYYASSSLSGGIGPGPWSISMGVDPANVERAVNLAFQEVARFTQEPVSNEELADSKASYIGQLPLSLESNGGVASALLNLERFDLGLDYYQRYSDLINAVNKEQVLEAAQRYLNTSRLGIAVAGP
jgi:zinc protease